MSGPTLNFPSSPALNDTYAFGGKTWTYNGSAWKLNTASLSTTTVTEGTNLYFTNARSRASISVTGSGTYDSANGIITVTGGVTSVGGATGTVSNAQLAAAITSSGVLTTSNVAEGTSLYFTTARTRASLDGINGIAYGNTTGNISLTTTGVTANTYGGASKVPVFTVDTYGRITSAANVNVAGVSTFSASGNTFTIGTADGGSFSASIQPNSVVLGQDTTGNYVASMTAGNGITVGTATGEGSTPVITNTGVLSVNGQTGNATGFATTANSLAQFASTTSADLRTLVSDETGSGSLVFSDSPVLVTPNIGTPSYAVLTYATGLPVSTGITGFGSGIATFLATPSSANLASAVIDETGTGNILFSNSPVLVTPNVGTPSYINLTNATGLNISAISSGLNANVATFLGQVSTSANLAALITDETGTGALVFGTSPAITTSLTTPSTSFDLVNSTATTVNFAGAGTTVNIGAATGNTNILNSMVISGNLLVQGTTTTVSSTTLDVADKNVTLAKGAGSSAAADGAGITIDGAGATLNYVHATTAWTSSQDVNLASGKVYKVNNAQVLSATALGTSVVTSNLTSVGTIATGVWNGSEIATTYTAAKVTSVNGQTGAATGFATTANSLSQFGSTTSSELATLISDETGTGSLVFGTSPVLTTPNIGTPSYAVLTNATGLPIASGISGLGANVTTFLADPTSAKLAFAVTDETGSGSLVFSNSPILVTPNIGTPSYAVLTSATGLPLSTGISGLGADQTTLLAANAQSGVTAATYGSTLNIPVITVDVYGRITSASNVAVTSGVSSVGGATGAISNAQLASAITSSGVLTTANVSEVTNLYFTNTRSRQSITAGSGITYDTANGIISASGTYTDSNARAALSITGTKGSYSNTTGVFNLTNIANVTVSASVPGSPNIGDIWFDDADGAEYLYFNDGTSVQWVEQAAGVVISSLVESVGGSTGVISNAMIAATLTGLTISPAIVTASGNVNGANLNISGPGYVGGLLTVAGNLIVLGTTTTVSSATLDITDKNITIAKGAADSSAADGAGITVDGASASLNYSHSGTKWVSNKPFNVSDSTASTSTSTGALIVAGGIGVTGNIVASGQVTAADINSSSDKRLKKNIKTVTSALDTVNALRGVTFEWKEGKGKSIGLIAQEVKEVLPEIVSENENGYLGIRYNNVIGVLVEAIKELKADFEEYKKTHP